MNQIKTNVIKVIHDIPDKEASTFEDLIEALCTRYQALEGIEDLENGNVITTKQLREDVANWK